MAKQRYVNTIFWRDDYISNLDPSEKLLFLYFLTCPDTNISGIYQIPLKIVAADTGFDKEMIIKMVNRFQKDDKMMYCNGWIVIRNFIKHQKQNPSVQTGIKNEIEKAPGWAVDFINNSLVQAVDSKVQAVDSKVHLNTNLNLNFNTNTNLNTNQLEKVLPEAAIRTAQYLYDQIQEHVKPPTYKTKPPKLTKWAEDIDKLNRLDGIQYNDIMKVIDHVVRDKFWKSNILSGNKLREHFDRLHIEMCKNSGMTAEDIKNHVDNIMDKAEERKRTGGSVFDDL